MLTRSINRAYSRYRTLQTDVITSLPIVILMPHSACNCRCVMCDIWKDNKNLKQLTEQDIKGLLSSLKKFGTQQVLMSGGEALLNNNFFELCRLIRQQNIRITLLSTGLTIKKNVTDILLFVNDLIVSIDGDEYLHDAIRNLPGAFEKLKNGVEHIKSIQPDYPITARTVIHRLNYRNWEKIIAEANNMGIDQISFLPADVSSNAFNRPILWEEPKQQEVLIPEDELPVLKSIITNIINKYKIDKNDRFIAESAEKLSQIYQYYAAFYQLCPFPFKKCNAPWVSTVVEADGNVRPCFFHEVIGNIHHNSLSAILNSKEGTNFRKTLKVDKDPICQKCVCSLYLSPLANLA